MDNRIETLSMEFMECKSILVALGDENRLHMILEMMKSGKCSGLRVGEITEKSNLSRPAVSHHLKILKEAGLLKVRKEGTKNYYYFDSDLEPMKKLIHALNDAVSIAESLPDRDNRAE